VVAGCRSDRVTVMDTYQYNDSSTNDTFQREPYCVKFLLHDAGAPSRPPSRHAVASVLLHNFRHYVIAIKKRTIRTIQQRKTDTGTKYLKVNVHPFDF